MTLAELVSRANEGQVHALEVLSLQGGRYMLRAQLADGCQTVQDRRGKRYCLRSTSEVRALLGQCPVLQALPCALVQYVAHDEACAARSGPVEPLRLPLRVAAAPGS
ncbi:MAG: DUF6482 family protein [Pseudomonas sp.]|uniref:DUF6482 family protein n=1 Tax=Pseudomonas sp. TaxID=306 RepID=UPI00324260F9